MNANKSFLSPPQAGYWKRYYYKPEALNDLLNNKKNKDGTDAEPVDLSGLKELSKGMRDQVMVLDRPPPIDSGGRSLTFHNVLSHKYTAALGKAVELDAKPYEYCKSAHTSTKKELDFVLMNYYR